MFLNNLSEFTTSSIEALTRAAEDAGGLSVAICPSATAAVTGRGRSTASAPSLKRSSGLGINNHYSRFLNAVSHIGLS